ncbi:MAG: SDR family oxidoreductase [Spirochaetaceae bacterium]|nr:SDR family oxidoreductase [Spirochaetaceae bacterium]MDT8299476.1 SDR family oxidoreductase [Spirochaetaceae bacterium]
MTLEGRTAMVTGGARRLGAAIVRGLAANGCRTIIHCRNSMEEAKILAGEIRNGGGKTQVVRRDLADPDDIALWFESLSEEIGEIDILVNSASEYIRDRYETMSPADLNRSMAIHAVSPLAMITAMKGRNTPGAVVNLLDTRTSGPDPGHASYHLGKRALAALTRELAVEMAPNIRINAVSPGIVLPAEGKDPDWIERMALTNPMGRWGHEGDVVDAVLYLIRADFVTGEILHVDGGRHLNGCRNE